MASSAWRSRKSLSGAWTTKVACSAVPCLVRGCAGRGLKMLSSRWQSLLPPFPSSLPLPPITPTLHLNLYSVPLPFLLPRPSPIPFFFFFRSLPLALDCSEDPALAAASPSCLFSGFPCLALPLFPDDAESGRVQSDLSPFTTRSSSRSSMFISSNRLLTRTPSFPAPPGRRPPSPVFGPSSSASSSSRRTNCRASGPRGSWPRCSPLSLRRARRDIGPDNQM